jgi:protein TonB
VAGKPREVQGVIVDSADSMPNNAPAPTPKPKGPISGGVLNGRAISLPLPSYPPIAKAAKAAGTVVVQVLIDENGKVMQAHAVSGHALLRKAAEEAALTARFAPTQLSGQPVKVTGAITYNFVPE